MKRGKRAPSQRFHWKIGGRDFMSGKKKPSGSLWQGRESKIQSRKKMRVTQPGGITVPSRNKQDTILLNLPSLKVTLPPDAVFLFSATSSETPTSRAASEPQFQTPNTFSLLP